MSLVITLNLIVGVVVVGGWTAAVWAFYRKLGDPYEEAVSRRRRHATEPPDDLGHDLTERRAA